MTPLLSFFIPDLPKMTNDLLRRHWTEIKREKDKWHRLVALEVKPLMRIYGIKEPLKKASITFARASVREPDWDGLISGFKFVTDGLVECGLLIDDKYSVIGESRYLWKKCKRDEQGVRVEVYIPSRKAKLDYFDQLPI